MRGRGRRRTPGAPNSTRAIDEAAEHLSLYQLTIEQDTPFAALHAAGKLDHSGRRSRARSLRPDAGGRGGARPAGLRDFQPRTAGRSAATTWSTGAIDEYAGIGPGAHGRLTIEGKRYATATEKRPESWLMRVEASGHGVVEDETLTRDEQADEFLLMGLRLAEGIDPQRYAALAGRPLDEARIAALHADGFVETTPHGRLRVTPAGFPVLDAVVADLAA